MPLPANVGFFGDSITSGLGTLSAWFGANAVAWKNYGFAGHTSGMLLELVYPLTVPVTVETFVVIQCGVNDITTGVDPNLTQANIAAIVAKTRSLNVTPILGTTIPLYSSYPDAATYNPAIDTLNTWEIAWAAAHGVTLIDYHAAFVAAGVSPALYRPGEGHPNTNGNTLYMATAGLTIGGAGTLVRREILRDVPASSGETVLAFASWDGSALHPRDWTFRPGDPGYTGTGMTDAALDALARSLM